jgi:predicted anti-sigma-YlaC factor YlaD
LGQIMSMTAAKIYRVRARFSQLSPAWVLPKETLRSRKDPWVRRLGIVAASMAILMVLLFIVYKVVLGSGVHVTVASGASAQPLADRSHDRKGVVLGEAA